MKSTTSFLFAFLNVLLLSSLADATVTENITTNCFWDGVGAYIAVDRQVIQKKLNDWHDSISSACDGPRLYLPTSPVFPKILNRNQHVVYIGTGYMTFHDFQDLVEECISVNGMEFIVTIPLLTDHPDGIPFYSLALKHFYERGRGDIPKPNIAMPYEPVDEITRKENGVVLRKGSEKLQLSYVRYTDPCKIPNPLVRHEFDEYIDQGLQFGVKEPDFSFCDRHPVDNRYCMTAKSIRCEVHRSSPNICQTSWKETNKVSCETPLQMVGVTQGFRDMMLLGDGEIKIVASQSYFGNTSVGLKYPCII
ncbi:hypothetical protein HOLleu_26691 [Holothuria leucospilota]|uniref:Uncharacterized protein n=1 Tax=Holothuria leucospilota TaxID=206669 RepID=A0A9Q1H307_HOLLE|nr:hypothetical protein HOLleu_26691 [Holothuria leucospilota]